MQYIKYTSRRTYNCACRHLGREPKFFFSFDSNYQIFEVTDEEAHQLSIFTGRRRFHFLKRGLPEHFRPCWKA
jgi:hypothetical protein